MTDKQCDRCGEVNPAEIHTCTPKEPVAWMYDFPNPDNAREDMIRDWIAQSYEEVVRNNGFNVRPLYSASPQREWQRLTDEEIKEIIGPWGGEPIKGYTRELIDKIEAKLKEKNG